MTKAKIIAEAGSNHNGKVELALKLVDVAVDAKADIVKFQMINPDSLYVPYYWRRGEKIPNPVHARRKSEVLSFDEWKRVANYAVEREILFTASAFDKEGVDFLISLNAPFIKISSSDLNNHGLLNYLASKKVPAIVSTGMGSEVEINAMIDIFKSNYSLEHLTVMHCVSIYPCPLSQTRIGQIDKLKESFNVSVGFSDHTQESIAACIAITKGVDYIEKHYTIDKTLDGFDHKYASSPEEFKKYVSDVREVETAMNIESDNSKGENVTRVRARRGLYLSKPIKKGTPIQDKDVVALRPTNQLDPTQKKAVVAAKAGEDLREFEPLKLIGNLLYKDENANWEEAANYWEKEMQEKNMK